LPVLVTLQIFSQREDPTWLLSPDQTAELLRRISALQEWTPFKAHYFASRLGYRGFEVLSIPPSPLGRTRLVIDEGLVDLGSHDLTLFDPERGVEAFLLSTAGEALDAAIVSGAERGMAESATDALERRSRSLRFRPPVAVCAPNAEDAPPYDPSRWSSVLYSNNCYNYANDQILTSFAEPGRAHGINASASCPSMLDGAVADGLVAVPDFSPALNQGEGWYVALVVQSKLPPQDIHWYRQDADGCWSHKPGKAAVTRCDASQNPITNPRYCDLGPYEFCTFMITRCGLRIS
jgi:hypothetical protein